MVAYVCVLYCNVEVVNMFLFSIGIKGNFFILGVPNLLVGSVYHVKNEGCLLKVLIVRLFNQTLSIYSTGAG